jgi:hypothetical protein
MAHKKIDCGPPVHLSNGWVMDYISRRCTICPDCGEKTNWTGHKNKSSGLYQIRIHGKQRSVRRVVFELNGGKLNPKKKIVTTCDNHRCLNFALMKQVGMEYIIKGAIEAGTLHTKTAHRKIAEKRRATCGKLTQEQARAIRDADGPSPEIAKQYGVSDSYIRAIRSGRARRDYMATAFCGLGAR